MKNIITWFKAIFQTIFIHNVPLLLLLVLIILISYSYTHTSHKLRMKFNKQIDSLSINRKSENGINCHVLSRYTRYVNTPYKSRRLECLDDSRVDTTKCWTKIIFRDNINAIISDMKFKNNWRQNRGFTPVKPNEYINNNYRYYIYRTYRICDVHASS